MKKIILVCISIAIVACASPKRELIDYAGFTLDDYIDSFKSKPTSVEFYGLEYRALLISKNITINMVSKNFEDWCSSKNGKVTKIHIKSGYGYVDYGKYVTAINFIMYDNYKEMASKESSFECVGSRNEPIAAYIMFLDKYDYGRKLVFFDPAKLVRSIEEVNLIEQKKREKERELSRKFERESRVFDACMEAQSKKLRETLKPGVRTSIGMVVEVKPPIASVQVINANTTSVVWVDISTLKAPLGGCSSN